MSCPGGGLLEVEDILDLAKEGKRLAGMRRMVRAKAAQQNTGPPDMLDCIGAALESASIDAHVGLGLEVRHRVLRSLWQRTTLALAAHARTASTGRPDPPRHCGTRSIGSGRSPSAR